MLFNVCDIRVKISFFSISAVTLIMLYNPHTTIAMTVIAAIIHEMGHLIFLIFYGDKKLTVKINILGMRIVRANEMGLNIQQEVLTALAGPVLNVFVAILSAIFGYKTFFVVNLSLAAFNLLPIMELDGGRAIFYGLKLYFDESKVEKITFWLSLSVLFPLAVSGWLVLIKSRGNFTLFAVSVYLIVLLLLKKK